MASNEEYPWEPDSRREPSWDVPNLHYAAAVNSLEAVRILLDGGADPDLLDGCGRKAAVGRLAFHRSSGGIKSGVNNA
jgi:hypothetical protein